MTGKPKTLKVFIASPNDLVVERQRFKEVIDKLNAGFAEAREIELEPLAWEARPSQYGVRNQDYFNELVNGCDAFVLCLSRRWGQPASDFKPGCTSYTEEEFELARERFERTGEPRIVMLFKEIPQEFLQDPGEDLKKVLAFRRRLSETGKAFWREFKDEAGFAALMEEHLKDFMNGIEASEIKPEPVAIPQDVLDRLAAAEAEAERLGKVAETHRQTAEAESQRRDAAELELARKAAKAALEGRLEEARQDFARLTAATTNLNILFLGFEFYERTGELDTAEKLLQRWLSISGPDNATAETAAALGNLGLIYYTRGELDEAEKMHRKSLEIHEKLGSTHGLADNYGNLGLIYRTRGELDEAEQMHRKSLEINEKLGRLEGMARDYASLACIYWVRGDLDEAEQMYRKGLEINEKLGRLEGMALSYANLGAIYQARDDLDEAEKMYRRALEINEKLGWLERMANLYGNLGVLREEQKRLSEARELWIQARDLFARIGMPHKVKKYQGYIDSLPKRQHSDQEGQPRKPPRKTRRKTG